MSTIEKNGLMTAVDESGNTNLLYPITRISAVDGLEEKLSALEEGSAGGSSLSVMPKTEFDALASKGTDALYFVTD